MEKKTFSTEIELKEDSNETGEFQAIFSRFNEVDKQGDVTRPGAFIESQPVRIAAWGHDWGSLPVGKGVIHQDEERAWVDGQFFMDTEQGKQHYLTVKNLGDLQQWSYGFSVLKSSEGEFEGRKVRFLESLDTHECSPVFIGAGNSTATTIIKNAPDTEGAIAKSESETESETVKSGNESGVDPVDFKFLLDVIQLEVTNE